MTTRETIIESTNNFTCETIAGHIISLIFYHGNDEEGVRWDNFAYWLNSSKTYYESPISFTIEEDTSCKLGIMSYVRYNCYNIDTNEFLTTTEKTYSPNATVAPTNKLEIENKSYKLISYTPNPTTVVSGPQWGEAYYREIPTTE